MNYLNTLASYNRNMYFVLDSDHNAIAVDDREWAQWHKNFENRQVAEDFLHGKAVRISTACQGMNLAVSFDEPPIIFETMIFALGEIIGQRRYSTWDEAVAGHQEIVAELNEVIGLSDEAVKLIAELDTKI